MKITLKTLSGTVFDVEVEPDTAIGRVKDLVASSEHGIAQGWDRPGEAELLKLLHKGNFLQNETTDLASYRVQDGDFIVIMPPTKRGG